MREISPNKLDASETPPVARPPAGEAAAAPGGDAPGEIQTRRELEALFDNALIGMALTRSGRVLKINVRGAAIFGLPLSRLTGFETAHLFPSPDAHACFLRNVRTALADSDRYLTECLLVRSSGEPFTARLQGKVVADDPDGETVAWVFDDVTEQKRLEDALLASKLAAESASEAKSQLLANMSHELRTPLNGILGLTQILLDSAVTGETREYLGIIRQSAGVLMHIMGDLLDLSNVEAGRLMVEAREFDPREEFTPLLRNFSAQSQLRPFTFSYAIDPSVPKRLIGDPDRTRQICIHLLSNAFKFTRKGQVTAHIARDDGQEPLEPGRVRLRIRVVDTGIGIEPEQQQAVFEPFGIGENYLTKQYSGAGLGLAIARRLADLMGGGIDLHSEPGRGSTFTLTLEYDLPRKARPAGPAPEAPARSGRRSLRILLAEDEPVNRLFTERILGKLGHQVETAADGQEALDLLGRNSFDIVLMDIQMPRLNGLEATRRIRSGQVAGLRPTIPVVALTAYAMESDRVRGLEAGLDEYVAKPFEPVDLIRAMDRALARVTEAPAGPGPERSQPDASRD